MWSSTATQNYAPQWRYFKGTLTATGSRHSEACRWSRRDPAKRQVQGLAAKEELQYLGPEEKG